MVEGNFCDAEILPGKLFAPGRNFKRRYVFAFGLSENKPTWLPNKGFDKHLIFAFVILSLGRQWHTELERFFSVLDLALSPLPTLIRIDWGYVDVSLCVLHSGGKLVA